MLCLLGNSWFSKPGCLTHPELQRPLLPASVSELRIWAVTNHAHTHVPTGFSCVILWEEGG